MDANEPAFPIPEGYAAHGKVHWATPGLSKRELLAAMAMQGYCSQYDERICPSERQKDVEAWRREEHAKDAKFCAAMADALITELAKPREQK